VEDGATQPVKAGTPALAGKRAGVNRSDRGGLVDIGHVKISRTAVLAAVGWYLMMPPTQEQLDSTCRGGLSVMDHVAALIGRDDADKVHTRRCDQGGSLFWTILFSCCKGALFICIGAFVLSEVVRYQELGLYATFSDPHIAQTTNLQPTTYCWRWLVEKVV
jgi:hypothetical protein